MPKNSLKKLLDMFPYFFDKTVTSNFYKSQSVSNNQFKQIYNDLFKVIESFHLTKKCFIWKEQTEAFEYVINFVAKYPHLKTVNCFKNDELIYSESYLYEDEISNFMYSYEGSTLNDSESLEIIPTETFKIYVETYDENVIIKGFPENDTTQGNIYDHDNSLDNFGALHNIPRKKYIPVDSELYPATEPPYNNCASEDDYHYMNRILNYTLQLHTTPLPILELWKLYGVSSYMENREKLLLKMFDENRHTYDENNDSWTHEQWEHIDKFCDYQPKEQVFFFIKASTKYPPINTNVNVSFLFLNMFGEKQENQYLIDIFSNDTVIVENCSEDNFILDSSLFSQNDETVFKIIAKNNDDPEVIGEEKLIVLVRSCDNANYYVSTAGDDSNTGTNKDNAFATLNKALSKVQGDKKYITMLPGTYTIDEPLLVTNSCYIVGCGEEDIIIENTENNKFFKLQPDVELKLDNINLEFNSNRVLISEEYFVNGNETNDSYVIVDEYEEVS